MAGLKNDLIIIGFDTEYTRGTDGHSNIVLSYQFAGKTAKGEWSGIIYPKGKQHSDRIKLVDLIGRAIEEGRLQNFLPSKWPDAVYATAHFSRADLPSFQDFDKLKKEFDSIRKTFVTLGPRAYKATYTDKSRNQHKLKITLLDTMLLTPGASSSLDSLGDLYDFPKIEIPEGSIEKMDQLLMEDPALFESYAIRDAEICAKHAWEMAEFAAANFGLARIPVTLGSLATKHVEAIWNDEGIERNEALGKELVKITGWNVKAHRLITKNKLVLIDSAHIYESLATECFHGGRNEAYVFGFTNLGEWTDYDLAGAYTTAMAAIRIPDFDALVHSKNVRDYKADELGLARIRFKFPPDTLFPSLPVRTSNGLIFPLEGETYVGSPELFLATNMGAEIKILDGIIIPWKSPVRPFEVFAKSIRDHRQQHDKGSIHELIWKEIGNSLYGKLAQGLRLKRTFDSRSEDMKPLPPSSVTQPFFAAYITSLVRAVLGEILHRIPDHRTVVSATTDGFLSDVPKHELDLSGPLCKLFSILRKRVANDTTILEIKHQTLQVLCWKTRGQASPNITGQGLKPVLAKAGIKPSKDVVEKAKVIFVTEYTEEDDVTVYKVPGPVDETIISDWIMNLFLGRLPGQTYHLDQLISLREMFIDDSDLVTIDRDIKLNMDYDWKRELVEPEMHKGFLESSAPLGGNHLYASSKPWATIPEFRATRDLFDTWRTKHGGLLKTLGDWESWSEFRRTSIASQKGVRRRKDGLVGQAKLTFLKAYTRSMWGLPGGDYKGVAEYLTKAGYNTTENDLKNAKRSQNVPVAKAIPADENVTSFIRCVMARYPKFEWREMVTAETEALDLPGFLRWSQKIVSSENATSRV